LAILFVRSRLVCDTEMLTLLIVVISNLGVWVGGYTYIFYIALIPVFMKMHTRLLYISLLALIAIPLDIIPLLSDFIGDYYSYLGDTHANIQWTLGLGSVVRPVANLILLLLLSCEFFVARPNGTSYGFVQ